MGANTPSHETSTLRISNGAATLAGAKLARRQPTISLWYKSHAVFVKRKSPQGISLATTGSAASDNAQLTNLQRDLKPIGAHAQSEGQMTMDDVGYTCTNSEIVYVLGI